MATVRFTSHLKRFFPTLQNSIPIEAHTVAELVAKLDQCYPGLSAYLVDERGALRRHVNIFIGENLIHDRSSLSDPITQDDAVFIMQALSGG